MFDSTDARQERFWRVGIARNAVFFHSFVASNVRKGRFEKRGGAKDRLPKIKMSTKFAPRLRTRAIRRCSGRFLRLKVLFAWQAQGFRHVANTWQAQEFVRVAKTLAGAVDLKRLRNDAFRVAGAVTLRLVMSMFEASDAESVEGLQIS